MDREKFLKELKNDRVVIEVNSAGKIKQLKFLSESENIPNCLIFINEDGTKVSKILDNQKLDDKEIGSTKFFFNPEDAISYCNRLYLHKAKVR